MALWLAAKRSNCWGSYLGIRIFFYFEVTCFIQFSFFSIYYQCRDCKLSSSIHYELSSIHFLFLSLVDYFNTATASCFWMITSGSVYWLLIALFHFSFTFAKQDLSLFFWIQNVLFHKFWCCSYPITTNSWITLLKGPKNYFFLYYKDSQSLHIVTY